MLSKNLFDVSAFLVCEGQLRRSTRRRGSGNRGPMEGSQTDASVRARILSKPFVGTIRSTTRTSIAAPTTPRHTDSGLSRWLLGGAPGVPRRIGGPDPARSQARYRSLSRDVRQSESLRLPAGFQGPAYPRIRVRACSSCRRMSPSDAVAPLLTY